MRTKNLLLVGIAVCAILLTSPVLASADYSKIYGNANEDDVLDMRDVTYIKLVIFGKKPATTFADANYDGKTSMLDIGQTKLIILGKEKQLTLVDQADRIVTVNKPIEKVVLADLLDGVRTLVQLGAADKIVAINNYVENYALNPPDNYPWSPVLHAAPELKELPSVGTYRDPNLELIVSVKPDVIFAYSGATDVANTLQETLGIPVVCIVGSGRSFLDFELYSANTR
jgi:iron complex transport system substrate-binding protein